MMDTPVQDLLLSNIATQCSLSAHSLVNLLHAQIQSEELVAWWYNISCKYLGPIPFICAANPILDLHTCGSTLLMSRLCSIDDVATSSEFASSWKLCLQCISRYATVSSIAKKSLSLLKASGECLLPDDSALLVSSSILRDTGGYH